jgi:hypothetical protein
MSRLAPLVTRRIHRPASQPRCLAIARAPIELEQAAGWLDDAKLFAGGWVAGLVVFGTFLA